MTAVLNANVTALRAEALFASDLQPSDHPSTALVWDTVHEVVFRLGEAGCAAVVAQEYGDHPQAAVARMRWCTVRVAEAFPPV